MLRQRDPPHSRLLYVSASKGLTFILPRLLNAGCSRIDELSLRSGPNDCEVELQDACDAALAQLVPQPYEEEVCGGSSRQIALTASKLLAPALPSQQVSAARKRRGRHSTSSGVGSSSGVAVGSPVMGGQKAPATPQQQELLQQLMETKEWKQEKHNLVEQGAQDSRHWRLLRTAGSGIRKSMHGCLALLSSLHGHGVRRQPSMHVSVGLTATAVNAYDEGCANAPTAFIFSSASFPCSCRRTSSLLQMAPVSAQGSRWI